MQKLFHNHWPRTSRIGEVTLCFLLGVIAWGGYVRASGSGAGCGSHWPLCNGHYIPVSASSKTLIEFTHRITSGISLILCLILTVSSFRQFPKGSFSRRAGAASLFFILTEALLGAALVLLSLVEKDQSLLRALSLGVHLLNTFILLASVALTVRWSKQESLGKLHLRPVQSHPALFTFSILGILGLLVLGSSGAMTALGDTLFPAVSIVDGLKQDLSPTSHFLIQLRVLHPLLAILVTTYLLGFAFILKKRFETQHSEVSYFSTLLARSLLSQVTLGVMNILLLAPIGMQLGHLFLADIVWLCLIQTLAAVWVLPKSSLMYYGS